MQDPYTWAVSSALSAGFTALGRVAGSTPTVTRRRRGAWSRCRVMWGSFTKFSLCFHWQFTCLTILTQPVRVSHCRVPAASNKGLPVTGSKLAIRVSTFKPHWSLRWACGIIPCVFSCPPELTCVCSWPSAESSHMFLWPLPNGYYCSITSLTWSLQVL